MWTVTSGVLPDATVADHTKPRRGDWSAFRLGELQSCVTCRNNAKRQLDLNGYDALVALGGLQKGVFVPADRLLSDP